MLFHHVNPTIDTIAAENSTSMPTACVSSTVRHLPSPEHNVRESIAFIRPYRPFMEYFGNSTSYPCKEEVYAMPSEMEIDN